jgi:hypothetical protein
MKKAFSSIFIVFIFVDSVFSMPQSEQILTKQTVEKIIEHRLDIFELLYKHRIYNYTFSPLSDYYVYNKPAHEWPDAETIKYYYNETISMEIPEKLHEYFNINNFENNAFAQYVTSYYILDILNAEKQYMSDENILNKILQIKALFNTQDIMLVYRYQDNFTRFSYEESERLQNIHFINIVEPGDLTLDDNFMNNYIKMAVDFSNLDEEIDSVDSYNILIMYCNGYLMENQNYRPYDDYVQKMIQQVFNSEESEEVTQLFNKYNIENGFHKFVIASTIVQILIYEKLFLRELPELEDYIKNDLGYWINYDKIEPYLKNVNNLLQSFNDRDIRLIRQYMDGIVENILEGIK